MEEDRLAKFDRDWAMYECKELGITPTEGQLKDFIERVQIMEDSKVVDPLNTAFRIVFYEQR